MITRLVAGIVGGALLASLGISRVTAQGSTRSPRARPRAFAWRCKPPMTNSPPWALARA